MLYWVPYLFFNTINQPLLIEIKFHIFLRCQYCFLHKNVHRYVLILVYYKFKGIKTFSSVDYFIYSKWFKLYGELLNQIVQFSRHISQVIIQCVLVISLNNQPLFSLLYTIIRKPHNQFHSNSIRYLASLGQLFDFILYIPKFFSTGNLFYYACISTMNIFNVMSFIQEQVVLLDVYLVRY